jgi:ATP diphosphatase
MTSAADASGRIEQLLAIMARLRGEGGCPWDREQSFASIAPFTIEEAYEVADAIDRGHMPDLKDELGDLLFQVVFHAQLAKEAGDFDFAGVAAAICDKLVRRHPHVFLDPVAHDTAQQSVTWEAIKAEERGVAAAGRPLAPVSELDGIPQVLPALMRAYKLSKRAARVGFDFEHAAGAADKVAEELAEVRAAADAAEPAERIFEEIGDLLFAAANLARKLGVDAEAALRAANVKFERRFRGMEALARGRGIRFDALSLAAQEALWQEMKRGE